ncbi:class I SAM-dependent methyltransferase [Streptomyces sp. NPDC046988]|uniref:class I SAM-dependent methyltransferase n=1 Tax=Streptomyces sp. NPDC046988 TaxID=3154922 RepID=UPI00340FB9A4
MAPGASDAANSPLLPPGDDPVALLDVAAWALAALVATLEEAATRPLDEVLRTDPARTAVLEAARLVRRTGDTLTPHPSLVYADGPTAHSAAQARLSSLRQAVTAAAGHSDGAAGGTWEDQDDAVLLSQGRASAMTGRALAGRVVPALPGLADRLARKGSRILDVGTGVAALALALARGFPQTEVVGIDVVERVLALAAAELANAEPDVAGRVTLRHIDVADLTERNAYDLTWLPAPFLSEDALTAAVPRLADALRPGGWVVVGTNPAVADPLRRAVAGWNAVRGGGNSQDPDRMAETLTAAGAREVRTFPTVPGGPVLVTARWSAAR